MNFRKLFGSKPSGRPAETQADRGLLVFDNTSEVIRAEKTLRENGWSVKVMGPPPEIQRGCDLVVEIPLIEELNILRTLEHAGTAPLEVVPVTGPLLTPVDLFQVKDFGAHLMVRAANMKITVEKSTRTIVNISGGGCPDVPYIAARLIGRTLDDAPSPRDIGHTLCGYALNLAFEKTLELCSS
ncbi:DUF3343 domain-containing protein [Pseudodesulfovibrio portus]|uniref:Se/S carrier protein-like domain-containing protein n=1 Tax=Pseudodesulfovibrio portus TaxID=231439 RepID=A0ABN6RRZ6_9BACT|nr:DUF3343 domain-containing protein [Pseudodesulfovibrio portus]BDQ33746.1 hypothetical protein JCM14722_12880 [Pseudodesulfovibrio portus]